MEFALPYMSITFQTYSEDIMNLKEATKTKIEEIAGKKIVSIMKTGRGAVCECR